jgi:SAM-dependent methyltransferase
MDWVDFFNKIKFTYYRSSLIQMKYIDVIQRVASNNSLLLEIASGSGYTSAIVSDLLSKKNAKVIATDISEDLVKELSNKFSLDNLEGKVIDAFNIDMANKSVDIIFHQGFLEHFDNNDIIKILKEQGRVAKTIVFDVPNGRRWDKTKEFGDERFLSHKEWINLVHQAGLEVKFHTGRRFTNAWKKYVPKIVYDSDWFGRLFGESSIIVCKGE